MATSSCENRYDAIVIGAGPAGATAALILARHGWSVAIVERSMFPRRKVCGEFISATTLPLLIELGLGGWFDSTAGPPVRRVGLFAGDTVLDAPMPKASRRRGAWGRAVGRDHLDLALLEASIKAGATAWQPWTATALVDCGNDWICEIQAKTERNEIRAPVVIAASGSWQRSPIASHHAVRRRPSDLLAFKAHFERAHLPDDLMPLLAFPGGYGGMVWSDDGRLSLSCCIRRDALTQCRERSPSRAGDALLRHLQHSCGGVREVLHDAEPLWGWLSAGPIRPGIREHYREGVFKVGNLAGEAHPVIAEGISMAMQSAWLLCRHLVAARDRATDRQELSGIGQAYRADWQKSFRLRIAASAAIAHLVMRPSVVALWLPLTRLFPKILTIGAELSGKTRVVAVK